MSQKRLNDGSDIISVSIAPYEHPVIYEYLGKNRYLQASFCKSVQQLYLARFGMYTTKALSNIAAEEGFIGVLEWSKEIGCRWDDSVFVSGARGGHVDVIRWLVNNDCPMQDGFAAWRAAAERGNLEVLKFARDSNYLQNIEYLCEVAIENGRLNVLKWIYEVEGNTHFDAYTCQLAAKGGFIEIIKWLPCIGCEWDGDTCQTSVHNGHVDILRWALDNGCPWDVNERELFGLTALHFAEDTEMIEFLIHLGADINAVDIRGRTPIYCAVVYSDLESVKAFVRLAADVNIADKDGRAPLDEGTRLGRHEVVEVLRAAGAREPH